MTTVTLPRATVEQALEALESGDWYINQLEQIVYSADDAGTHEERAKVQAAITALRAALAQQAEPVRSQQMADAGFKPRDRRLECDECGGKFTAQMLPIHKCAQQAEPVEPVAHRVVAGALFDFMGWLTSRRERLVLSSIDDAAPAADAIKAFAEMRGLSLDDAKVQDWNAAPPQRKPLTDEDIERIFMTYQSPRQAARAVERAHGITDPQIADRLARHGIPMPDDENPSF